MSKFPKDDIQRFAEIFKALSNPNRLKIFMHLVQCCVPGTIHSIDDGSRRCVGDLGQDLEVVPSTISHHIKELRRAGLIKMERRGQKIECWVDSEVLKDLESFFSQPMCE